LKKLVSFGLAMTLLLSVFLTGCSSSESTAKDKGKKEIALIVKSVDSEYWLTVKAGAEKAAKELGVNVTFKGAQTETDIAGQISIVESAINQKVDAIALAASDSDALVPPVEKAVDAGIPVVTIDSGVNSDKPQSFIATDNEAAAATAADTIAEIAGKKGDVAVVSFVPGAATAVQRETGFEKGLKNYSDMKIVTTQYSQSDKARALSVTEDILTANPGLVGIFGSNNKSALGAAQAVKQKGLTDKIALVAFDADPDEITALQEGTIDALVVQNPFKMGYLAVKNAVDIIDGKKVEKRVDTGVTVVTMKNFEDEEVQKLLYPEKN
jgi:ribose transport system substrate-binding protein